MDKATLRREIREKKRAMPQEEIVSRSEKLAEKLFATKGYQQAKTIYGYLPFNQEVRTVPILEQALRDGKRVAVPKVYGDTMKFLYVEEFTRVAPSDFGVPEPIADTPVADDPTALVLMPGLAFTKAGERMGYGGGYYDRFLAQEQAHPTVALCFEFQIVESLPTEAFDIPVDMVLWA